MTTLAVVVILGAAGAAPVLAHAAPPSAKPAPGAELGALLAELQRRPPGDSLAALRPQAEALLDLVASRAPLELVDVQLTSVPAEGLGIYTPQIGPVRGAEVFVYAQVRNHGLRREGGWYELHMVSDLVILDADGKELARDEGFGESRFRAKAAHRDTFVNIALRVQGLPQGNYTLRLVLHDRIGKKDGQADVPFVMP